MKLFLLGETDNVAKYIEDSDVVIAIGRCILEAIAMKRIAIITANDNLKGIINQDNIADAIDSNFNGRASMRNKSEIINAMESVSCEDIIKSLDNIEKSNIQDIILHNYNEILKKLDVRKNSYCITEDAKVDYSDFYCRLLSLVNEKIQSDIDLLQIKNEIQQMRDECNETCEDYEKKIEQLNNELEQKKNELDSILSSRRWKLTSKVVEPVKKLKSKLERKNNAK